MRLQMEDWELTTATMNQESLESNLSRYVTHVISILESLPNPTGFREQGKSVIYFFGTGDIVKLFSGNKGTPD